MAPALNNRTAQVLLLYQKMQSLDIEMLTATDQAKMKFLITSRDVCDTEHLISSFYTADPR